MNPIFAQGPSQTFRLLLALAASIALMVFDQRYQSLDGVRSTLSAVTYPLQWIANLPVSLADFFDDNFSSRDLLALDNEQLERENLRLKARLLKLEALEAENTRLRDLLDSSFKVGDRVLIAEISAVDLDPFKQQIVVKKGQHAGVYQGQAVLDSRGVIGQVIHVNPFSSTVLLITDASHGLPVDILRNGIHTIAVGGGRTNLLKLPYLTPNSDVRIGDLLVTSGLGGRFPSGYPVAEITDIRREPGSPFLVIDAQPRAKLDRVREVLLVWSHDPVDLTQPESVEEKTNETVPSERKTDQL